MLLVEPALRLGEDPVGPEAGKTRILVEDLARPVDGLQFVLRLALVGTMPILRLAHLVAISAIERNEMAAKTLRLVGRVRVFPPHRRQEFLRAIALTPPFGMSSKDSIPQPGGLRRSHLFLGEANGRQVAVEGVPRLLVGNSDLVT